MNKETEEQKKMFILCRSDGSVRISGGLVFCRGALYVELGTQDTPVHQISNNIFYTRLPRWWQLRGWWQLLRELRVATQNDTQTAVLKMPIHQP